MAKLNIKSKQFYQGIAVVNPKRDRHSLRGRASWYPYYAGFSHTFAKSLISSLKLNPSSQVLDPWNGSGTTSASAAMAGHHAQGFDINPVMVIAARARMVGSLSRDSLLPLAHDIRQKAADASQPSPRAVDPLETWLTPDSTDSIRRLDTAIRCLLTNPTCVMNGVNVVNDLSDLASFYYVALFRSVRRLLGRFFASNPTWVKKPSSKHERLRPSFLTVSAIFDAEVRSMVAALDSEAASAYEGTCRLAVASSDCLPVENESIDLVLTSPPYCTRIDYAIATSLELAVLGVDSSHGLTELRRAMIGTSVVPPKPPQPSPSWGPTCLGFLEKISRHPSKASAGYYLKNHLQYFQAVFASLEEISRSLVPNGTCALVVQDSHYKDVHNDLPQIFIEMGGATALRFGHRVDFEHSRIMAGINPHARHYRFNPQAKESVLFLNRQ